MFSNFSGLKWLSYFRCNLAKRNFFCIHPGKRQWRRYIRLDSFWHIDVDNHDQMFLRYNLKHLITSVLTLEKNTMLNECLLSSQNFPVYPDAHEHLEFEVQNSLFWQNVLCRVEHIPEQSAPNLFTLHSEISINESTHCLHNLPY